MLRLACLCLGVLVACGEARRPDSIPLDAQNSCPASGAAANETLTITLPAKMVRVHGTVGGNVTSVRFQSARTGVRYHATIDSSGAFARPLPSGKYSVYLEHSAMDFQNERPANPLEVPSGVDSFAFTPCAGADCIVPAHIPVPRSTDPTRTGRLSGKIVLASGAQPTGTKLNPYLGSVDLVPVIAGEGDPWYGQIFGGDMTFRLNDVAFGKYKVVFQSSLGYRFSEDAAQSIDTAAPLGQWTFPDIIEINQPETTWQGTLPSQAVHLQIKINGQPMPSNGLGNHSRGNLVFRDTNGEDLDYLPLGASGAIDFHIKMIPGRYEVGLESYLAVGHGLLKRREQDVLPTGAGTLGSLEVAAAAAPIEATFNANVRRARFSVAIADPSKQALDLKRGNGAYAWANLTTQTQAPTMLYAGCQVADQGTTEGPTTSGFSTVYEASLGEFCVPCP